MDKQKIFNQVAAHMLKQNQKAETPGSKVCYYRAGNLRCAIGCLIPDDIYTDEFEMKTVKGILGYCSSSFDNVKLDSAIKLREFLDAGIDDVPFLRDLQLIHDNSLPSEWREQLVVFAINNKLRADCL